jgi:uncharacterized membrane protein
VVGLTSLNITGVLLAAATLVVRLTSLEVSPVSRVDKLVVALVDVAGVLLATTALVVRLADLNSAGVLLAAAALVVGITGREGSN